MSKITDVNGTKIKPQTHASLKRLPRTVTERCGICNNKSVELGHFERTHGEMIIMPKAFDSNKMLRTLEEILKDIPKMSEQSEMFFNLFRCM